MAKRCSICDNTCRAEIENAILNMTSSDNGFTLEQIAQVYNVNIEELKLHAMFHTPLVSADDLEARVQKLPGMEDVKLSEAEEKPYRDSLTRKMKLRETDMLQAVTNEYLVTLKAMGRRINRLVEVKDLAGDDEDQAYRMAKLLTRPAVDLYLGLGGEIRQTVKAISDIERAINGPQNDTNTGLQALANAIRGSDVE